MTRSYAACSSGGHSTDGFAFLYCSQNSGVAMAASICGFIVLHPAAGYPEIRHIGTTQYEWYTSRRGFSPEQARTFLSHLL